MQSATKDLKTWTYTYNSDGLRTGKTNGTTTYTYTWNENGQLSSMVCGTSSAWFYYDHEGKPLYMEYANGNDECSGIYRYILNLQGDVVGLYDLTRNCMAMTYTYDAWGRERSWSTYDSGYAGLLYGNPLTYRGYIYDRETGFYYLQSRYYDPAIGRFLNADDTDYLGASGTLLSWNLFEYCDNNIVVKADYSGYDAVIITYLSFPTHTSIIVQNDKGEWRYFYWSSSSVVFKVVPKEYMRSLEAFNQWAGRKYVMATYAKGNTVKAYKYCMDLYLYYITRTDIYSDNSKYNLIFYNCGQASLDALSRSFFRVKFLKSGLFGPYPQLPLQCQLRVMSLFGNRSFTRP